VNVKGQGVLETAETFQLREPQPSHQNDFGTKIDDVGAVNSYAWDTKLEISGQQFGSTTKSNNK
jgi:hypothetical protein